MIRVKKKTIDRIIWSLFIFILVFYPPIVPRSNLVIAILSASIIFLKYRKIAKQIFFESGMLSWLKGLFIFLIYICMIPFPISIIYNDIVSFSHYSSLFNRFAVLVITVIPCCILLLCTIKKKNYDKYFFIEVLCGAGIIEGFTAILAFISPTVKNLFINIMRQNSGSSLYSNEWYITVRSYGFAGSLVDLFGMGVAIIAGIAFFYGVVEKKRYIIYSLIITVAAVLNARTGVLVYIIAIIVAFIFLLIKGRFANSIKALVGIGILVVVSSFVINEISANKATFDWIQRGFDSVNNFFESGSIGEKGTSLGNLFTASFWELPDTFRTIVGTGHSKYALSGYAHSDVGYINDIWFAGICGCVLLYGTNVKIAIDAYRNSNDIVFKFAIIYVVIAFFVCNIKCTTMSYNPGASAMFTILFTLQYLGKQEMEQYNI